MLYSKQQANPRSPLTVIRNQIRSTQQSLSRSISRSPSYSPVSRTCKVQTKDYNSYIPVRSSSKIENKKPKSVTSTHQELKSQRKNLVKDTAMLEKQVQDIKRKIETEVKISRIGLRKTPRSSYVTFINKLNTLFKKRIKANTLFSFSKIKHSANELSKVEALANSVYRSSIKSKYFKLMLKTLTPQILEKREYIKIANHHNKLQKLFKTFSAWQDFTSLQKLKVEDRSYIEEMDCLLESFIHDSLNMSNLN